MSYCRFSSDNWKCDIYAFAHVDGFYKIYVTRRRAIGNIPKVDLFQEDQEKALKEHRAQMDFLNTCEYENIELPHAGQNFNCCTIQEFKDKMIELREIGYHIPNEVFKEIDAELAEAQDEVRE